jgi:hypothetical protein
VTTVRRCRAGVRNGRDGIRRPPDILPTIHNLSIIANARDRQHDRGVSQDLDAEVNGWVDWLYAALGFDPWNPPKNLLLIARALFGVRGVVIAVRREMKGDGMIIPEAEPSDALASPWVMYLRPRVSPRRRKWAIAHEIAEWMLRNVRAEPHIEALADRIAAALIAPRQAYLAFHRAYGLDLPRLAAAFNVTESCMARRFGEATGTPTLLVTPVGRDQRGAPFVFGAMPVREVAKRPGVRSIEITDDPRRVLLVAEEVETA